MNYEFILKYYKSFCTKVSTISSFFKSDSSFFFVGDFGKVFVAYGGEQIQEQIIQTFWNEKERNMAPYGYNINIEQKERSVCVKPGESYIDSEVAIVVIGTIKAIYSREDIRLTKLKARKFVQTFILYRNNDNHYCKSSVLIYVAPSDSFNDIINFGVSMPRQVSKQSNGEKCDDTKQIITKLADHQNNSDSSSDLCEKQKMSDLLPISLNELFSDDTTTNDKKVNLLKKDSDSNENYDPYLNMNNIWSDTWQNIYLNHCRRTDDSIWIDNLSKISNDEQSSVNQNSGTSFADALRNNLHQSWNNYNKIDDNNKETQEIRIIQNCSKSRFKQNWQNSGKSDRRNEFMGTQNITIIGAQNLEDFADTSILFVANIPLGISKTDFMTLFNIYGKVLSMKFVERTGVSFAFVYFESKTSVDAIISCASNNSLNLSGLQLKIDRYKKRIPLGNQTK